MEKLTLEQFGQKVQADEALQKELAADFQAGKTAKDFIEKYNLDATEEELNKVYEMLQNPDSVRELTEEEMKSVNGGTAGLIIVEVVGTVCVTLVLGDWLGRTYIKRR